MNASIQPFVFIDIRRSEILIWRASCPVMEILSVLYCGSGARVPGGAVSIPLTFPSGLSPLSGHGGGISKNEDMVP